MSFPVSALRPLSVCLALALAHGTSSAVETPSAKSGFDHQRRRLITAQVLEILEPWLVANSVPGAVLALVDRNGPLVIQGFGVEDLRTGTPVDVDSTLFRAGELVRSMTAAILLELEQRALVDLEADLQPLLARVGQRLEPPGEVSAAQLLLHTSGLDTRVVGSRARSAEEILPLGTYVDLRLPRRVRPPGTISIPSSHGYALAGWIIEEILETPFPEALKSELLRPLGMSRSAVWPGSSTRERAVGHRFERDRPMPIDDPDFPQAMAASFLETTGADMGRWLAALVGSPSNEARRALRPAVVEALSRPSFSNHPRLPGRTLAFRQGLVYTPRELYLAWRGNGFSSVLMLLPEEGVAVFLALNLETSFWSPVYDILDLFGNRRSDEGDDEPGLAEVDRRRYEGYWRGAEISLSSPEKLVSLVRQNRISVDPGGVLRWNSQSYRTLGGDAFLQVGGAREIYALSGTSPLRLATSDGRVLEKLSWFEAPPVQIAAWVLFTVTFLAAAWSRPLWPPGRSELSPPDAYEPHWPATLAHLAAGLHLAFIVAIAGTLALTLRSPVPSLLYRIPPILSATFLLPLVAAVVTLLAACGTPAVWRSGRWRKRRRLRFVLLIAALLLYLPFLEYWNLLGFRL